MLTVVWTECEDAIVGNVLETSPPRLTVTRLDLTFQSVSKVLYVVDVVEPHTSSHDHLDFICPCLGFIYHSHLSSCADCR